MAKRSVAAKRQPEITTQEAQVRIDVKPDTPSYYVNYIGISHTPYEFTLSAAKIPSPATQDQLEIIKSGQPMPLEAVLQLVVPPLLIDGLIMALMDQKQKYNKTLEQQVKNNAEQFKRYERPPGPVQ